jgi:hypothetical protein
MADSIEFLSKGAKGADNCSGSRAGCNFLARDTRAATGAAVSDNSERIDSFAPAHFDLSVCPSMSSIPVGSIREQAGYRIARIVVAEESGGLCSPFEI